MEDLMEVAAVARVLGVTPAQVKYLAATGRLRIAVRTTRGSRLFHQGDVEALRAARARARAARTEEER